MFTIISLLASSNEVVFWPLYRDPPEANERVDRNLRAVGATVDGREFHEIVKRDRYDVILFEFYWVAQKLLSLARAWQPEAYILIDSVDIHFHRLRSKARLTDEAADQAYANSVRNEELAIYNQADAVVTVSDQDAQVLRGEGFDGRLEIVPNIHALQALEHRHRSDTLQLIFIGAYLWPPNVDAMVYFCREILPLLRDTVPRLRLRIVGSDATPEISALESSDVEVVGYVPDTKPYLASSDISVAPLRYGGGMKGKIGEAMAHGLPVVTTSVGAEGFGFRVGEEVLVGDTPRAFADAVHSLWTDEVLYARIRQNGWNFINERFTPETVGPTVSGVLERLLTDRPKRLSGLRKLTIRAPDYLDRYVMWRFKSR